MSAPVERKSIKVSPEIHEAVHRLSTAHGVSADETIRSLLNVSTVAPRLPLYLSEGQLARWSAYAEAAGMSVEDWVVARVEAAIQYGIDPGTMHDVLKYVRALTRHAGISVHRRPLKQPPAPSPFAEPQEEY